MSEVENKECVCKCHCGENCTCGENCKCEPGICRCPDKADECECNEKNCDC